MRIQRQHKLSQEVKRMACDILDPHQRGAFIRTMFQAEVEQMGFKNRRSRGERDVETKPEGGSND